MAKVLFTQTWPPAIFNKLRKIVTSQRLDLTWTSCTTWFRDVTIIDRSLLYFLQNWKVVQKRKCAYYVITIWRIYDVGSWRIQQDSRMLLKTFSVVKGHTLLTTNTGYAWATSRRALWLFPCTPELRPQGLDEKWHTLQSGMSRSKMQFGFFSNLRKNTNYSLKKLYQCAMHRWKTTGLQLQRLLDTEITLYINFACYVHN